MWARPREPGAWPGVEGLACPLALPQQTNKPAWGGRDGGRVTRALGEEKGGVGSRETTQGAEHTAICCLPAPLGD